MGIVAIMAGGIVSFSLVSGRIGTQNSVMAEVEQSGNVVVQGILQEMEQADLVAYPADGVSADTLVLITLEPYTETVIQSFGGRVRILENGGSTVSFLTAENVIVDALTFLHFGENNAEEGVSFAMRATHKSAGLDAEEGQYTRSFRGTMKLHPSLCTVDAECGGGATCCLPQGICSTSCTVSGGACLTAADCAAPSCTLSTCTASVGSCQAGTCVTVDLGKCAQCSRCGDSWVDIAAGEACDDGDSDNADVCTNLCTIAACGDSVTQSLGADGQSGGEDDEQCDDGNLVSGDGCSAACLRENLCQGARNGVQESPEECDDGNALNTDACTNDCQNAVCGDGYVQPNEACDDGNALYRDGCSGRCADEDTIAVCGNGLREGGEECDDGKRCTTTGDMCFAAGDCPEGGCTAFNGDGCSTTCTNENTCGDSIVSGSELLDTGATCSGGADAWFTDEQCSDLDPSGNPLYGVQRCTAVGGTCTTSCTQICRTNNEPCFTDRDCNEPDTLSCASCINGSCSTGGGGCFTNGQFVDDLLGQVDPPPAYPSNNTPVYTRGTANNGEGSTDKRGFNFAAGASLSDTKSAVALDAVNHRLFVADTDNHRVLVFTLSGSNTLVSPGDRLADSVLGQANFTNNSSALTAAGMNSPRGLAFDATSNRLFVADSTNNRVLVFDTTSITNGESAVSVLGQGNFTSNASATTAAGMSGPRGLSFDSVMNRLFVADSVNNRILAFDTTSIGDGEDAVSVLGQANFTASSAANPPTAASMNAPQDVSIDTVQSRLFVVDSGNNRILIFEITSLDNGEDASFILGQTGFTTNSAPNPPGAASMNAPRGLFLFSDTQSYQSVSLAVADTGNNRVLVFDAMFLTNGENAVSVLGQASFTANAAATTAAGMNAPRSVVAEYTGSGGSIVRQSHLFITDSGNHRILLYESDCP